MLPKKLMRAWPDMCHVFPDKRGDRFKLGSQEAPALRLQHSFSFYTIGTAVPTQNMN